MSPARRPALIQLRFDGVVTTLPISELASALDAVQRMIYKVYLAESLQAVGRPARLSHEDRTNLALRISTHRRGSDLYSLTAFADGAVDVLTPLIPILFGVFQDIFKRRQEKKQEELMREIAALLRQLALIVGNIGGTNGLRISSPAYAKLQPVELGTASREQLDPKRWFPTTKQVTGAVVRLDLLHEALTLEHVEYGAVHARLSERVTTAVRESATFRDVRDDEHRLPKVTLWGRWIKRRTFEATRIRLHKT